MNFPDHGENCIQKFSVFQCGQVESAVMLYWPACQDAYKRKSRAADSQSVPVIDFAISFMNTI